MPKPPSTPEARTVFFGSWVSSRLLGCRCSCHTDHGHQPADLVLHDMAMKHPVAGVVRDERDPHALPRADEHRVAPDLIRLGPAIAVEHPKAVAMQVHRVPPRGFVPYVENAAPAARDLEQRRHARITIPGHGLTVDGPDGSAAHAHPPAAHAHTAHHPALEPDFTH